MKKPLEIAWMGPQVGWDRGLKITRVGQRVIDQWRLSYGAHLLVLLGVAGFSKGTMASANISVWEKAAPPTLTPILDNSVHR